MNAPPLRTRLNRPGPAPESAATPRARFTRLWEDPTPTPTPAVPNPPEADRPAPACCGKCGVNLLGSWATVFAHGAARGQCVMVDLCPTCDDQLRAFLKPRPESLAPALERDPTPAG